MAQLQMRPHSVRDIINASFALYRKRFGPMIVICLLLVFIPFLVSVIGGCTVEGSRPSCESATGWIGNIASQIGAAVASAAATLVAVWAYAGIPYDWRKSVATGLRRIVQIVAATVVAVGTVVVSAFGGVVLLFLAAFAHASEALGVAIVLYFAFLTIFLAISFAVFTPALMIERIGPMQSLGRSWRLVSGERWRIFGAGLSIVIVFGIAVAIVRLALSGLTGLSDGDVSYYVRQIMTLLGIPLTASVGAVLYVDLKVRKEDLDSAELGALLSRVD